MPIRLSNCFNTRCLHYRFCGCIKFIRLQSINKNNNQTLQLTSTVVINKSISFGLSLLPRILEPFIRYWYLALSLCLSATCGVLHLNVVVDRKHKTLCTTIYNCIGCNRTEMRRSQKTATRFALWRFVINCTFKTMHDAYDDLSFSSRITKTLHKSAFFHQWMARNATTVCIWYAYTYHTEILAQHTQTHTLPL